MEGGKCWAARTRKRGEACGGRPECGGEWAAKTVKRPPHQPAQPQCANYWDPLPQKRHRAAVAVRRQRPDAAREGKNG